MNVNYRRSLAQPHISRLAMEKYKIRASIEEAVVEKAQELDNRRWEELNAYATAVDATLLVALHRRYRFTADTLYKLFCDIRRIRLEYRQFFRDENYREERTGHNIEDTAIFHDLMAIGVDIKAWEEEDICVDEVTGEVTFRVK